MSPSAPDLIIANARALTSDPARPTARAVAVAGGRIAYVGPSTGALALAGPQTRVVDAGGATLLPGFVDSHYHLLLGSLRLDGMQLGDVGSHAELAEAVRAYAASHPGEPWLAGYQLRYGLGPGGRELTRHDLDAISAGRPVLLTAFDGHTAWASTRALELGGVLGGHDAGPNSEVVMGADGLAAGELREGGAIGPLRRLIPPPGPARRRELLRQGLAQAARLGITSVHNMDGDMGQLELYRALERDGELTLRVYVPYSVTPASRPGDLAEAAAMRELTRGEPGAMARGGAAKFFMDGVVEGYTALLLAPYPDRDSRGEANFEQEHFVELAVEADRLGLQIFVHAIGDLAVRRTLDAYAAARAATGARDSRHRVEHIELVDPADVPRFAELGAVASMQPYHAPAPPGYGAAWLARAGRDRWRQSFAWADLAAAGARLAFGSDWPVVTQSPLVGLAAAVCRQAWAEDAPAQAIPLEAALAAYTTGGAYAEHREGEKGMLREGMQADLALLDRDITAWPADQIAEAQVRLTVCGGRVVHEA